jgi:hypothetical protein
MPAAAHSRVVVVVGAQAIYLHTGAIELAVAEYTTGCGHHDRSGAAP